MASGRSRPLDSSSDDDSGPTRRKQIHRVIMTPVKNDTDEDEANTAQASRSSDRLKRRNSRSFQMPSREKVWRQIPSTPSPDKSLDHLKPRKLVNNFTRITHSYNQDRYYTDGEDSDMDGFMVSDGEASSNTEDSPGEGRRDNNQTDKMKPGKARNITRRKQRVKGYRRKIELQPSSSSSEAGAESGREDTTHRTATMEKSESRENSSGDIDDHSRLARLKTEESERERRGEAEDADDLCVDKNDVEIDEKESDNESVKKITKSTSRRRSNIVCSSDNSDSDSKSSPPSVNEGSSNNETESSQNEEENSNVCSGVVDEDIACQNNTDMPLSDRVVSECSGSSSDSRTSSSDTESEGSDSNSDDGDEVTAETNLKSPRAVHQFNKQATAKKKKFEAFLEARKKRVPASKEH